MSVRDCQSRINWNSGGLGPLYSLKRLPGAHASLLCASLIHLLLFANSDPGIRASSLDASCTHAAHVSHCRRWLPTIDRFSHKINRLLINAASNYQRPLL